MERRLSADVQLPMTKNNGTILSVNGLKTYFQTEDGIVKAVDGITFTLEKGETLGIVGESGSGKSVTNLSVMRLIPEPPGKIVDGDIGFVADADEGGQPQV